MPERATITVTAEAVLTLADQLAADALRAASVQDWRTANDGLTDAIRDLCDAARHLPGHGPTAAPVDFLTWDAEADGWTTLLAVRTALRGDCALAASLLYVVAR